MAPFKVALQTQQDIMPSMQSFAFITHAFKPLSTLSLRFLGNDDLKSSVPTCVVSKTS
jgi:hypothetical protein